MIGLDTQVGLRPAQSQGSLAYRLHLDTPLLLALLVLAVLGFGVLYSAGAGDPGLLKRQLIRLAAGFTVMTLLAQIRPSQYRAWAPGLYAVGVALLIAVLALGEVGKGAQRWLNLGIVRFQPSEAMKLAMPLMIAWFLTQRPLPPSPWRLIGALLLIAIPVLLIAKQPDLGTAILIGASGLFILFFAGLSWRLIVSAIILAIPAVWVLWNYGMKPYQQQRVLTFINPESDPLGSGYHIIQSIIAIGSGGSFGKGWMNGTQSQLNFIPERSTDFIFAVYGEEFGLLGGIGLLLLYLFIIARGLIIAINGQDSFSRLVAGSLAMTFLIYVFVNIGMVSGILPVVGVPLPLISYGGTSMVTLMAGFGILMSIQTHRRVLGH